MTQPDHFEFAPLKPAEIDTDPNGIIGILVSLRSEETPPSEHGMGGGIFNDASLPASADSLLTMIEPESWLMENGADPNDLLSMVEPYSL